MLNVTTYNYCISSNCTKCSYYILLREVTRLFKIMGYWEISVIITTQLTKTRTLKYYFSLYIL